MESLSKLDTAFLMHGQTNARRLEAEGPTVIMRGEGVYVFDEAEVRYFECLASMWNVALGFSEQRLIEAANRQYGLLPVYHTYYGRSHPPAIRLAERLIRMAPGRMAKAFFTNSGSEAVETAVKMVRYFNNSLNRPQKKKIISRSRAYHGSGVLSGSLTGLPALHAGFDLPQGGVIHVSAPHYRASTMIHLSEEAFATDLANELEATILKEGPETVAALIAEPVIGSGGVIVPPKTYWAKIQAVLNKHDILLVADEVITGFARTGEMFGCELYGINPDILILSKQITSGYAPLGAVLLTAPIYHAIADLSAKLGTFGHAFTSGSNPVSTAIAIETLDIMAERDVLGHVKKISVGFQERLKEFAARDCVAETRGVGLLGAVELSGTLGDVGLYQPGALGRRVVDQGRKHGLLLRASGDTIAFCPPLIIGEAEIDEMFSRFGLCLDEVAKELI